MAYPYVPTTRVDGEVITAAKYMADQIQHATENRPESIDDYAGNTTTFRLTEDPGTEGSESLPTTLAGELTRLRFVLQQIKATIKGSAPAQWYVPLSASDVGGIMPTGAIVPYAGPTAPAGWLLCDGSAVSRATYAALFAVLTPTQTGNTTNGSAIVTGLTSTADLRAGMALEGTGIPAGATIASVDSATQITLSAAATATGSPTLRFFPFGAGDGSTTFNVPDFRGRLPLGQDDMGGTPAGRVTHAAADGLGGSAGSEALQNHVHSISTDGSHNHGGSTGAFNANVALASSPGGDVTGTHSHSIASDGSHSHSGATGNPTSTVVQMPPYLAVNYLVKT